MREIFDAAVFVGHLGIRVHRVEPGVCETTAQIQPFLLQQDGFVHAGVLATMADHTGGGAAGTLIRSDQGVLSIEFKINMLRPAKGLGLRCVSSVLRPGRTISVAESEVYSVAADGEEALVAKAMVTLAVVAAVKSGQPPGRPSGA